MYDFFSFKAETETFGRDLHQCFRRFLAELIILCSRCLGGIREVEQLVEHRIVSFLILEGSWMYLHGEIYNFLNWLPNYMYS